MNIDKLAECLKPWMQAETWHTNHPVDTERFNKAIKRAVSEFGTGISADDFQDAMESLLERLYPGQEDNERFKSQIEARTLHAEHVITYLQDTQ